jgi:hypothetical protein
LISPAFFLLNSLFRLVKLLRFDSLLLDEASENVDMDVGGRLGISAGAGDVAPRRLDIEPFGVLRFRLGKRPNCAVCRDDMDDVERGDATVPDVPDTEE